jgi:S1-C subfamily serine protease
MALGGMRLDDLSDTEREAANLGCESMALRVRHAGKYEPHDAAHRAGVKDGDIITTFDGLDRRTSETALIARTIAERKPGEKVTFEVLRDGQLKSLAFAAQ